MRIGPSVVGLRGHLRSLNRSGLALAGNCAYAFAQFGVLVVLARYLTPAEVGAYALALAVTAPVQIGIGLRLRTVRAIDTGPTPFHTYLRLAVALSASAALVSTIIGALISADARFVFVVGLVAVAKGIEGLIDLCYGEYERGNRTTHVATSQLIRALLTVALVAIGADWAGLIGAVVAMLAGWALQLLILEIPRIKRAAEAKTCPGQPRSACRLARSSWPLGVAAAVASLTVSMPRFVVAWLLDAAAVGVLAVLSYPTTAVSLFANSVGQANVRSLSASVMSRDRHGVRSTLLAMVAATCLLGLLGIAVVVAAGPDGISWLFGPTYADHFMLVVLLLVSATLAGVATNLYYLLVSTGRFGWQPVVVGISLALSVPVVWLGTRHSGLHGTAVALIVMYALQAVLTGGAAAVVLRRTETALSRPLV